MRKAIVLAVLGLGLGLQAWAASSDACALKPIRVQMYSAAGKPIQVPDNLKEAMFLARRAGFQPGAQLPVVGPDGTPGYVSAENAARAFGDGWHLSPAKVAEAERRIRCRGERVLRAPPKDSLAGGVIIMDLQSDGVVR